MQLPPLEPDALTLFLFGPGEGESVVIHAPAGSTHGAPGAWLVVDGCTAGELSYPERLLAHYEATPSAIVLSHPHRDHARGLARLVERFTPAESVEWPMLAVVPAPDTAGAGDAWDATAALQGGVAEQAVATIFERWRVRPSCRWNLDLGATQRLGEARVRVLSPTPAERDSARHAWLAGRKHDYNRAATALLVTWRGRRVLLGSDLVERPGAGWTSVVSQVAELEAHDVYKVAHHGAIKAVGPQVRRPSTPRLRAWLTTPFASKGLPKHADGEGLSALLDQEDTLDLTALPVAYAQQGSATRDVRRSGLGALTENAGAAHPTGFPDCFLAVVVREHAPVEIVRGAGSVRVRT